MFDALANQIRLLLQDAASPQRWRAFQERCKEVIVTLELHGHDTLAQRVEREYCEVREAVNEWAPDTERRLINAAEELMATLAALQRHRHRLEATGSERQSRTVKPVERETLVEKYLREHPEASARTSRKNCENKATPLPSRA